jgi:hypothetical protein
MKNIIDTMWRVLKAPYDAANDVVMYICSVIAEDAHQKLDGLFDLRETEEVTDYLLGDYVQLVVDESTSSGG